MSLGASELPYHFSVVFDITDTTVCAIKLEMIYVLLHELHINRIILDNLI